MKDSLKVLGTHSQSERQQDDYYATPPIALEQLWKEVIFETSSIYDPCVGGGHINKFFEDKGIITYGSDIVDRGWPNTRILNFLTTSKKDIISFLPPRFTIVTNPPYKKATEFVEKGMEIIPPAGKMIMLLPLRFLEGSTRYKKVFSKYPPNEVLIFVDRIGCWKNGIEDKTQRSAICYAWFVWKQGFKGTPTIRWIDWKGRV